MPPIRSAPQTSRPFSEQQQKALLREALRLLPYDEYLQSAWWRERRNLSLQFACYQCQRCGANRDLQVHHLTYERLGAELDEDLEVICCDCHEVEHADKAQGIGGIGIYARMISDVLSEGLLNDFAEIIEETKCRCASAHIPFDADRFNAAVSRLTSRFPFLSATQTIDPKSAYTESPPSRREAAEILARLNAVGAVKQMPQVKLLTLRQAERQKAARILAQGILEQVQRCEDAERVIEPKPEVK